MKRIFILFLISLVFIEGMSQARVITGKILDEKQNPLSGASVFVKNSKTGIVSSADGIFSLQIPPNADTLIVSFAGYFTKEVRVAESLFITLKLNEGSLSEVQIVGYGSLLKTNLTGSAATIEAVYLEDKPFSSVDKTLQGSVAGLNSSSSSGAPGSLAGVLIRGFGSINSNPSPLWVIDGAIATTGDNSFQTTTANTLSSLNPDDIESITVLKDAATTAVFGSRAANGVILVTTKKGKAGNTRIHFSAEAGANSIAFKPSNKPVTSLECQTLFREAVINAGLATENASADAYITEPNGMGINPDYTKTTTNWLDVVSGTGNQSQYNLSIAGGDAKTQFYASGGLFNQDGTTIATNLKRYNGDLNLQHVVYDKLKISAGISGSAVNQNTPSNAGDPSNPVFAQHFLLPWYAPYNADGSIKIDDLQGEFPLNGNIYNPEAIAQWNKSNYIQNVVRGNVSVEYKILDNLKLTSLYSAEYFDIIENQYLNPNYGQGFPLGAGLSTYENIFDWTWTNIADYHQVIGNGIYYDVKLGYEAYDKSASLLQAAGVGFPDNISLQYLASSALPIEAQTNHNSNSTISVFSVADFNFKDRYILSGSFRRDGSSRFGTNNKWGNFYSVGGAWNINKEAFLKDASFIYVLKLRASYGQTGNQEIGDYTSLSTFGYRLISYANNIGSALTNIGNPDLTWEKSAIFNLGLDISFFKNRLSGTIEYYDRNISNLIVAVPLSLTTGILSQATGGNTQNRNVGGIYNKGYEITLNGDPVLTPDFTWNVSFNIAHNKSRVTQLYLGNPIANLYLGSPTNPMLGSSTEIAVGHQLFEYYMPLWAGVNQKDGTPMWFTDGSKTQKTGNYDSAQPSFTGISGNPQYYGSFTNTFSYKGLSIQVQFYYLFGNYLRDLLGILSENEGFLFGNFNPSNQELTAWQKPGDKTNIPQLILGGNHSSYANSTRFLYKGDYIRLRNIILEYAISSSLLKRAHINNLSVYVRGTNLLTYVKDKNLPFDPEEGATQTFYDVYQPKTIAGGIKVGF